jgi:hypothetical protein
MRREAFFEHRHRQARRNCRGRRLQVGQPVAQPCDLRSVRTTLTLGRERSPSPRILTARFCFSPRWAVFSTATSHSRRTPPMSSATARRSTGSSRRNSRVSPSPTTGSAWITCVAGPIRSPFPSAPAVASRPPLIRTATCSHAAARGVRPAHPMSSDKACELRLPS